MKKELLKSSIFIGLTTFSSRIFGFLRDVIIALFFGTGWIAQAFVVAYKIPNVLRSLVAEGAMNAAFIPVFSRYVDRGKPTEDFWQLVQIVVRWLLVILVLVTICGMLMAPWLVRMIAPGFDHGSNIFTLTTSLTRALFPYIVLISLASFYAALLNTLKHFKAPSLGPLIQNLVVIFCIVTFYDKLGIYALVLGILYGGAAQCIIQVPALLKKGFKNVKVKKWSHPALGEILSLLAPRAMSSGIYQISTLVDTILATLSNIVGAGAVAAFYYANRLIYLPLALFGFSVNTVALPMLSRNFINKDMDEFKRTANFALKVIFFLMAPASVGLIILSEPIIALLFERGAFDSYSTLITTIALKYYSIGLIAYGGSKILSSCFFAMHDTKTPLKCAAQALLLNIVLNVILMFPMKLGGLALATSLSNIGNFLLLYFILQKKIGLHLKNSIPFLFKSILASLIMALLCQTLMGKLIDTHLSFFELSMRIIIYISIGVLTYLLSMWIIARRESQTIVQWILKRK